MFAFRNDHCSTPSIRFAHGVGASLALAMLAFPAAASADAPDLNGLAALQGLGEPVGDEELGQMRGKFIRSNQINYFGISMVTSWQDSAGITTTARLVFSVDFVDGDGGPVPQLMIGWVRDGDPAMDVNGAHDGYTPYVVSGNSLGLGGLGTQDGVAQANIIAGADNSATNNMRVALVPSSQLQELQLSGLTLVDEGSVIPFVDGDMLEFRLAENQIALVLTGNEGLDSSIQSIGGDAGSVLQQTVLNSHFNTVRNSTDIIVGTGLGDAAGSARMTEAITVMRGFGF